MKVLCHHSRDGHRNAHKAVVVDADPDDIEPRQTTLGRAPRPALTTAALGEPIQRPDPRFDGPQLAKEVLLRVQIRRRVVAEERKEGGNGKGLVAVRHDLEVDGVPVPLDLAERGDGVDGDHEEDADDLLLLARARVVDGVEEDEGQAQDGGDEGA